jgi:hypothetical protein
MEEEKPAPRLVFIEWTDSHAVPGWQDLDAVRRSLGLVCRSVGWLIHDDQDTKILAPHLSEGSNPPQGSGIMMIPARAVLREVDLTEACIATRTDGELLKCSGYVVDVAGKRPCIYGPDHAGRCSGGVV